MVEIAMFMNDSRKIIKSLSLLKGVTLLASSVLIVGNASLCLSVARRRCV